MASINNLWDGSKSAATLGMSHNDDGSTTHLLISGARFKIAKPPPDITMSATPRSVVVTAVETHNELAIKTHLANSDQNLSQTGRKNTLAKGQIHALLTIAQLCVTIKRFRESIDVREQKLYAVPPLNAASAGDAIRDWEARDWFDKQPHQTQLEIIVAACKESDGDKLIASLLRGPFPKWNKQAKQIEATWREARRNTNVTEAEAIDSQRQSADWAFEQLALMASMVRQLCATWGNGDVLQELVKNEIPLHMSGHEIFGFSDRDARTAQRLSSAAVIAAAA